MSRFYREIYKLKNIIRKGWLIRDAKDNDSGRFESDAEHTFSMCMLALEIMHNKKYRDLDQLKVLKMCLYHELCEIDAGDHTPYDKITKEEKYAMELNCIKRLSKECKMPEILDLWLEFEENKTPEAQFVKKLDKLDAVMQSKIYGEMQDNPNLFNEFYNYSSDLISDFDEYL